MSLDRRCLGDEEGKIVSLRLDTPEGLALIAALLASITPLTSSVDMHYNSGCDKGQFFLTFKLPFSRLNNKKEKKHTIANEFTRQNMVLHITAREQFSSI